MAETLLKSQQAFGGDGWQPAKETWTYATADAPTFTITVPSGAANKYSVGMRIKLTQTTVKYFIITAVADTVLTVYGGTDYTLANAAISLNYYSPHKAPLGFPLDPAKWTVEVTDTTQRLQNTPTDDVVYNTGSINITIPIGCWKILMRGTLTVDRNDSGYLACKVALSTANNTWSSAELTAYSRAYANTSFEIQLGHPFCIQGTLTLSSKTVYYANFGVQGTTVDFVALDNGYETLYIRAICAYL